MMTRVYVITNHGCMLSEKDKKFVERWERWRKMGKWKFYLFFGVIGWGLPTLFLLQLFYFFFDQSLVINTITEFLLYLLIFIFAGTLYGYIMRGFYEKRYDRLKNQ